MQLGLNTEHNSSGLSKRFDKVNWKLCQCSLQKSYPFAFCPRLDCIR